MTINEALEILEKYRKDLKGHARTLDERPTPTQICQAIEIVSMALGKPIQ